MKNNTQKVGQNGTTKKDIANDLDNSLLSVETAVGSNNQTMPNLGAYKEKKERDREKEQTASRKPRRGRPKKASVEAPPSMSKAEAQIFLRPLFDFTSAVLVSRGVQEFSEKEINTGIDAWLPILNRYMPAMGDFAIWIPPIMWTGGVIMCRMPKKKEPIAIPLNPKEEGKKNDKNDSKS